METKLQITILNAFVGLTFHFSLQAGSKACGVWKCSGGQGSCQKDGILRWRQWQTQEDGCYCQLWSTVM